MEDNRYKVLKLFNGELEGSSLSPCNLLSNMSCQQAEGALCVSKKYTRHAVSEYSYEYIFVPGLSNPRWLVKNTKASINNLGFFVKPTSFISKIVWAISIAANKLSMFGLFYKWRLTSNTFYFQDFLRNVIGDDGLEISAIYTGARSSEAKIIIQISKEGNVRYYCKIGMTRSAIDEVSTELSVLQFLKSKLQFVKLPPLVELDTSSYHEYRFFVTDNVVQSDANVDLTLSKFDSHAMFDILSIEPPTELSVLEICKQFDSVSDLRLDLSALDEIKFDCITFVPAHGDYIPWNRVVLHDGLLLLDWERYGYYPLFFDHIYFMIHVAVLVRHVSARVCYEQIIQHMRTLLNDDSNLSRLMSGYSNDHYISACIIYIYCNYAVNKSFNKTHMLSFLEDLLGISSLNFKNSL